MPSPTQCRKIIDDILFDSFGVYHYVFLDKPIILIGEYNFVFEATFGREDAPRNYNFAAMRADVDELLIMIASSSSRLRLNVFYTDEELQRVTILKRYSPDYILHDTEHSVPREEAIRLVTYTIRDEIGDRHQI